MPPRAILARYLTAFPEKKAEVESARAARELFDEDEIIEVAKGSDSLEDVQRSRLRVDALQWRLKVNNRAKYGDKQQIDVNETLDIGSALEAAQKRVMERRIPRLIEAEVIGEG